MAQSKINPRRTPRGDRKRPPPPPRKPPGRGVSTPPGGRGGRPASRPKPGRQSIRSPQRTLPLEPKALAPSPKKWISITKSFAGKLGRAVGGRAAGLVGDLVRPDPTASPAQDAPPGREWARPVPRPASRSVPEDPKGNTGDYRNAPKSAPKRGRLGGRLPPPAARKSLRRARADRDMFRLPVRELEQVAPTKVSDKLDGALGRPVSRPDISPVALSPKKLEKLERKRKARKARKAAPKPSASPKPSPKPDPKPVGKPAVKPAPKPVAKPSPSAGPKPIPPSKPTPVPAPKPTTPPVVKPGTPSVPVPEAPPTPVKPPVVKPKPDGNPDPNPVPKPDPKPHKEVVIDVGLHPNGAPRIRVRERHARDKMPKRERDQKARGGLAAGLHALITKTWGEYTELRDFYEIFLANLYRESSTSRSGRLYADDLYEMSEGEVLKAFVNGEMELDVAAFLRDLVFNELEDVAIGRLASALDKRIIEGGHTTGPFSIQQRLNALRRAGAQGPQFQGNRDPHGILARRGLN